MKHLLFSFLTFFFATVYAEAQTLQVDPILERGQATFEIQNGTPGAHSILMISTQGSGPFSTQLGVVIDLTPPIQRLPFATVDALGFSYNTRSYSVPENVLAGRQLWFQGIQLDVRSSTPFTVTNMVPITVQDAPSGGLVSWGSDFYGQVSDTPTTNAFAQVSAGQWHSVALKSDGSLVAWGNDNRGQVAFTPTTNDFTQVSAGASHGVALKSDGSLVAWGYDNRGQVAFTPTTNDFTQVSAGASHGVALKSDGSLVSWGYDAYGQVSGTPTTCLLYTSPSPRDRSLSRMPSSA